MAKGKILFNGKTFIVGKIRRQEYKKGNQNHILLTSKTSEFILAVEKTDHQYKMMHTAA